MLNYTRRVIYNYCFGKIGKEWLEWSRNTSLFYSSFMFCFLQKEKLVLWKERMMMTLHMFGNKERKRKEKNWWFFLYLVCKNGVLVSITHFSPFTPILGGIEKVGPDGSLLLCFFPTNQIVETQPIPSFPFRSIFFYSFQMCMTSTQTKLTFLN